MTTPSLIIGTGWYRKHYREPRRELVSKHPVIPEAARVETKPSIPAVKGIAPMQYVTTTPAYLIQSTDRALRVLEIISRAPAGLSVAHATPAADIPMHAVRRTLTVLAHHEYVVRWHGHGGRYTLGPAFLDRAESLAAQLAALHETGISVAEIANRFQQPKNLVYHLASNASDPWALTARQS